VLSTTVESTLVESVVAVVEVVLLHAVNNAATANTKIAFFIFLAFVFIDCYIVKVIHYIRNKKF
jgi:hypothetical protein